MTTGVHPSWFFDKSEHALEETGAMTNLTKFHAPLHSRDMFHCSASCHANLQASDFIFNIHYAGLQDVERRYLGLAQKHSCPTAPDFSACPPPHPQEAYKHSCLHRLDRLVLKLIIVILLRQLLAFPRPPLHPLGCLPLLLVISLGNLTPNMEEGTWSSGSWLALSTR